MSINLTIITDNGLQPVHPAAPVTCTRQTDYFRLTVSRFWLLSPGFSHINTLADYICSSDSFETIIIPKSAPYILMDSVTLSSVQTPSWSFEGLWANRRAVDHESTGLLAIDSINCSLQRRLRAYLEGSHYSLYAPQDYSYCLTFSQRT